MKRNENPVAFEERRQYVDWLCKATYANSFPYINVIESAVYPEKLTKEQRKQGIILMDDLKKLLCERYDEKACENDKFIRDRILIQVDFAKSSLNSIIYEFTN